jgi:ABC-type amino acid transport system permease subunit
LGLFAFYKERKGDDDKAERAGKAALILNAVAFAGWFFNIIAVVIAVAIDYTYFSNTNTTNTT